MGKIAIAIFKARSVRGKSEYERRYHKKERVKCLNKSKKESNVHRVDAGMYDWFV